MYYTTVPSPGEMHIMSTISPNGGYFDTNSHLGHKLLTTVFLWLNKGSKVQREKYLRFGMIQISSASLRVGHVTH